MAASIQQARRQVMAASTSNHEPAVELRTSFALRSTPHSPPADSEWKEDWAWVDTIANLEQLIEPSGSSSVTETTVADPAVANPAVADPALQPELSWNEALVKFGYSLALLRQEKELSLDWLHFRTQVPRYHLQALEQGRVEHLPEEIFTRGFIRRICAQLGDEGKALLDTLPSTSEEYPAVLAPWQQQQSLKATALDLRSVHLYASYGLLVVGAGAGVIWSSQESAPLHQPIAEPIPQIQQSNRLEAVQLRQIISQRAEQHLPGAVLGIDSERFQPEMS